MSASFWRTPGLSCSAASSACVGVVVPGPPTTWTPGLKGQKSTGRHRLGPGVSFRTRRVTAAPSEVPPLAERLSLCPETGAIEPSRTFRSSQTRDSKDPSRRVKAGTHTDISSGGTCFLCFRSGRFSVRFALTQRPETGGGRKGRLVFSLRRTCSRLARPGSPWSHRAEPLTSLSRLVVVPACRSCSV